MSSDLRRALELTVIVSTLVSVVVGLTLLARKELPPRSDRAPGRPTLARLVFHPLAQLLFVCAALYVNQVLFSAYVLRAHGGSAAFIAQYIPGPWFAIGRHDPLVGVVAAHVGDGRWLSLSLLRVQAFLELPFTMFAYLAVARLLGRRLYATLCRLPVLLVVGVSFSVTFSIIELALPNPYTHDDLVLRAIAALVVPVYIAWVARRERLDLDAADAADAPRGVLGLLSFLAGAGAVAYVVLAIYDAFLLYNLAHLPKYAGGLVLAGAVAAFASFAAPRVDALLGSALGTPGPSPAIAIAVEGLRAFTLLFFLPSLALRYGGYLPAAVLGGLFLIGLALAAGLARGLRRTRPSLLGGATLVLAGAAALLAAGWAMKLALLGTAAGSLPELVLARAALSFLAVAIVVFRGVEFAVCWAAHETKAPADEA